MTSYAWVLPLLPLTAFVVLALFRRWLPGQGGWLAVVLAGASAVLFWPVIGSLLADGPKLLLPEWFAISNYAFHIAIVVDPLSVLMLGVVSTCSFFIQLYSLGYMKGDPRFGWYFAAMSLFTAAMLGLVLAGNLLLLYVCWELVGICSYLLIGFWYDRPAASAAAKKAFITTRVGDVGLFIGILLLFSAVGSFDINTIIAAARDGRIDAGLLGWITFLMFIGAMGKSGQFPLHIWLPDAMEGPTPVSALIHAATMVTAGVYLVARMYPLFQMAPGTMVFIATIGLISTIGASLLAMVMTDIKRILAYSTISQLGLMMMSLGAGGFGGALFHLTTHAFFKALLFLGAGSVIHATDEQEIDRLGGLGAKMRITAGTFLIGSLALAGFPLTSGYFSKDAMLHDIMRGNFLYFALGLGASAITAFYAFRLWFRMFTGPETHAAEHAHESPIIMSGPLIFFAVPALLLGAFEFLPIGPAASFRAFITGNTGHAAALYESIGSYTEALHEAPLDLTVFVVSAIGAIGGIFVAWLLYVREAGDLRALQVRFAGVHTLLINRFNLDALYDWLVQHVVLAVSGFIAWFDRHWINNLGVNGAGRLPSVAGSALRYVQTGRLSSYALAIVAGMAMVAVLLFIAR